MRKFVHFWAHMVPCVIIKDDKVNVNSAGMEFKKPDEKITKGKDDIDQMNKKYECPKKNENTGINESKKEMEPNVNKKCESTLNSTNNDANTKSFHDPSDPYMNIRLFSGNDVIQMLNDYTRYLQGNNPSFVLGSEIPVTTEQFIFKYSLELVLKKYFNENKKGLIINIEGVDGTGKNTQSTMLSYLLTSLGYENEVFHFPSYDKENPNFTGSLCNMMLEGKLGNINAVTPVSNTMFFIVDQIGQWHLKIKKAYEEGKIIILDRFYYSNLFHHMTKLTGLQAEEFKKWFDMTIKLSGLPYPDLTVYMYLTPEVAFERMEQRQKADSNHKSDIHEENKEYLRNCIIRGYDIAKALSTERPRNFQIIDGEHNPNHIHFEIINALVDAVSGCE